VLRQRFDLVDADDQSSGRLADGLPLCERLARQVELHRLGKPRGTLGHPFAELGQFLGQFVFPVFLVHQQFGRFTVALEPDTDPISFLANYDHVVVEHGSRPALSIFPAIRTFKLVVVDEVVARVQVVLPGSFCGGTATGGEEQPTQNQGKKISNSKKSHESIDG